MFTPKLLAVALAATFTLTACNSSIAETISQFSVHPVANSSGIKGSRGPVKDNDEENLEFSIIYSKYDPKTHEISDLQEGDYLKEDDRYKIKITSDEDGYVYVYQIDSTGKLDNLLKGAGKHHQHFPLKAGEPLFLPSEDASYELDDNKGVESIFVVVTEEPDPTVEKTYLALAREFKKDFDSSTDSIETRKSQSGKKGKKDGIVTDKTGEKTYFFNLSGDTTANQLFCEKQPSCASSISFFNNMKK
jgi:hypothetical protein